MLIHLLDCILPVTTKISNKGEAELAEQLRKSLVGKKYLIVLDDVWTIKTWDVIQLCFPNNFNGSRILITTRLREVCTYLSEQIFDLTFLTNEECWLLIRKIVFGERWKPGLCFESLGRSISRLCVGIPLAAVLIAGLLSTFNNSLEIWEDVRETLRTARISRENNNLEAVTSLCYNYLPNHMKGCFLYFGVFPEDSSIPFTKLINLWVAEGFLKPEKNISLEEVAKSYLYDLINRNLVQIDKRSVDGKIKRCKIHDRVHEMCVREAKKKNIMSLLNEKHALEVCRWISCQSSYWPITQASYVNHTFDEIRSLLYFERDFYLSRCRLVYPCLELLRVLDLSLLKYSHGMPNGIAGLIHLRYLALSTIGSVYKFRFSKLQNLQTLIVSSWMGGCHLQLPSNILDLLQLRHLHLEKRYSQCFPNLIQENLQTLYWLKVASSGRNKNFKMVPQLKELGIYIEGELVHGCLESLVHLRLLEKLKVEIGRVERFYLPTSFPPNLKQLTLRYTYVPWKEIHIVGKLPNLETLKLKDFAFCGSKWEQTEMGFKKLKVLLISCLDFTHWNASAKHFPILEKLVLKYCWELKQVPIDFVNIETLNSIVLESCYSSLVNSAFDIRRRRRTNQYGIFVNDLGTKVSLILYCDIQMLVLVSGSADQINLLYFELCFQVELPNK
nr:putative late blight resistance protein homolog R1B-17 [Ipomoea batatas]